MRGMAKSSVREHRSWGGCVIQGQFGAGRATGDGEGSRAVSSFCMQSKRATVGETGRKRGVGGHSGGASGETNWCLPSKFYDQAKSETYAKSTISRFNLGGSFVMCGVGGGVVSQYGPRLVQQV